MKSCWFGLISVILAVWCIVVDAERLQESERSFRDLLKRSENETTDGNDDWCSEWCTYSGETFVRPDLTAYCTCEGSITLTKVKRYCETGQVYNETLRRCHRLEGGGMPTCVLHGRTCPEGELGTREYPDGEFYENYLVCLEDAVIVASCAIGYHYESESGVCVKGDRKVTMVGRKDCPLAPDVQCEEIGTKAMQLHVKDRSVLERCGQCYYICNERNLTHYDLLVECVHNTSHITYAADETIAIIEQSDEAISNKTTSAPVGKIVFTDDSLETIVTSKERHTEILEETKPDVLSEVVGQTAIPQLEVVVIDKEHQKITEMDEVKKSIVIETGTPQLSQTDQVERDVPEVNVPILKTSEEGITDHPKPLKFTEAILPNAHDNLRSSEHETREVIITEEIESTEITEERVVESKTIAETSEIVLTDQEQGDVPEVKVPITETPEEMITEEPELTGFPEGALPEANIDLHNSDDVLTNKEYRNSPELDVPTTETPELVKTEEITSTEIIEESETIAETTEIVLITEKQRDVSEVKVPIQETSEEVITENPEPIELTEGMSPGADSVVNSSEDVKSDEEYQAVPELIVPTTETPALVTNEEIALTEITEMTILELETITETSEIVLTDEEIGDVPEVQVPISKTPEELITEEPEQTELPEGVLPEADIDLHNSEDILTNKEYQKSPELDVPTAEAPELVKMQEIASTEITKESETIAETTEIVLITEKQRDVSEVKVPIQETSEEVITENPEPIELTEGMSPGADSVVNSSEDVKSDEEYQAVPELIVPTTETPALVTNEEIALTEITEMTILELETITETSEIVLTDEEIGDVPEVQVPISKTPEELITEEPEQTELPEGVLPEADIDLHNSEDILTNKEYQKSPELDVPTAEAPELVKMQEIASTEITKESETIAETTEIVLITEKQRDVSEVKVPIQETSEEVITENPEPIELTEGMSPGADSVVNSSEDVKSDEEYQAVPELIVPTTETPALVTNEEIALTEITEMTILELETITETSEIVPTDEEIDDLPEVQVPISKTSEEMITEEPELTGFPEGVLPEANIDLHSSENVLTNKEYQKSPELDVPTTETPKLVITEEIASTEITKESETIAETTEIVLITEKQRDVPVLNVPIPETSEEVITENPEPIELTEGMSLGADSVVNSSEDMIIDEEYQTVPELVVPTTETPALVTTEEIASTKIPEMTILELETITETSEIELTDQEQGDVPEVGVPITSEEMITEKPELTRFPEGALPEANINLHNSEYVLTNKGYQKSPELYISTTETPELVITEKITSTVITEESETIAETTEIVLVTEKQRDVPVVKVPIQETSEEVITENPEPIELTEGMSPGADSVVNSSEDVITDEEYQAVPELDVPTTETPALVTTEEIASSEITEMTIVELETITETSEIVLTDEEIGEVPEVQVPISKTSEEMITEERDQIKLTESGIPEVDSDLHTSEEVLANEEHQKIPELTVPTTEIPELVITEELLSTEMTKVTVLESETITETSIIVLTNEEQRDVPEVEVPITEMSEEVITEEPELIELTKNVSPDTDSVTYNSEEILPNEEHQTVPELGVPTTETPKLIITEEIASTEITEVTDFESETITETSEIVLTDQEIHDVSELEVPITETLEAVITEEPETSDLTEGILPEAGSELRSSEDISTDEEHQKPPELAVPTMKTIEVITTEETVSTEITEVTVLESETITEISEIVLTDHEHRDIPEVELPITETSEDVLTDGEYHKVPGLGVPTTEAPLVIITEESPSTEITEATIFESETTTETSEIVITEKEIRDVPKSEVPITEMLEDVITETPETTEGIPPVTDSDLNGSEGILIGEQYLNIPELRVPTTQTPEVIITEESPSTEIIEVISDVFESKTTTETSKIVLTDQEKGGLPEVEVPITGTSEEMITEKTEAIEITEGIIPEEDSELRSSEDILTNGEYHTIPELVVPTTEEPVVIITEEIASTEITEVTVLESETITERSEVVLIDQKIPDVPEVEVTITEISEELVTEAPEPTELTEGILPEADSELRSSEDILTDEEHQKVPELAVPITETSEVIITEEIASAEITEVTVLEPETTTEISETVLTDQEIRDVPEAKVPITETSEEVVTEEPKSIELTKGILPEDLPSSEDIFTNGEYHTIPQLVVSTTETPVVIVTYESPWTDITEVTVPESEPVTETSGIVLLNQEQRDVPKFELPITETSEEMITEEPDLLEITEGISAETDSILNSSEDLLTEGEYQKVPELGVTTTETAVVFVTEESPSTVTVLESESITETSEVVLTDQELPGVPEIKVPITETPGEVIELIEITEGETEVTVMDVDNQEAVTVTVPVKETVIVYNEPVNTVPASEAIEEGTEVTILESGIQQVTQLNGLITVTPEIVITEKPELTLSYEITEGIKQTTEISEVVLIDQELPSFPEIKVPITEAPGEVIEPIEITEGETEVTVIDVDTQEAATVTVPVKETVIVHKEPVLIPAVTVPASEAFEDGTEVTILNSGIQQVTQLNWLITVTPEIVITEKSELSYEITEDIKQTTETTVTFQILNDSETSEIATTEQDEPILTSEIENIESGTVQQPIEIESKNTSDVETSSRTSETVRINAEHQEITSVAGTERSKVSDPTTTGVVAEETSEIIVHYPRNNSTENGGGVNSMVGPSQVESCKIYKYRPCEKEGFFRYRNSCTQHYQCFRSKACGRILASRVYECPGCLKFNQALMTCDLPENVPECVPHDLQHRGTYRYVKGYRTTDPMSTCTGPGRYPDPGDPSRYYECVDVFDDGVYRLTVNICPLGGKFDWSRGACARGEVRAQSRSVPRCMSSGYAYDRFDCHKFYLCEDGAPRVNLFCTDEYVFNGYYCQHKTKSVLCNWESLRKYLYKPR